jgi:type II secretory pathway pseudopilin PulG
MRISARSRLGFSLTELVAVLLVTLVLAAIAVPTYRAVTAEVRQDAVTTSAKALRNHLDALAAEEQIPTAAYDPTIELGLYNEDPEKITAAEYSSTEILVTGVYGSDFYYACITLADTVGGTSTVTDGICSTDEPSGTPSSQSITFAPIPDLPLSDGTRVLTASASSGLPVTFQGSTNTVCTVSGSTVTLLSAGTCTITASQSGGTNSGVVYMAAPPVARSFQLFADTVESFPLTATPGDARATLAFAPVEGATSYTGRCWDVDSTELTNSREGSRSATSTNPQEILVIELQNNLLHTCKVYADTGEFSETASVLPTAISPEPCPDIPLGGSLEDCSSGFEPEPDPDCPEGPITEATAGCGASTVVPTPTDQEISFAQPSDVLLSAGTRTVAASSSSGLIVSMTSNTPSVCSVSWFTVTVLTIGSCSLTATQAGGTSGSVTYTAATPVTRAFQVLASSVGATGQTITFPAPSDRTLGALPFTISVTASSGLPVSLGSNTTAVCAVDGSVVTVLTAGSCSLTATQAGGTSGSVTYTAATPVTRIFAVNTPSPLVSARVLDVTNHFNHKDSGPHHIFFGLQDQFGYTVDHSDTGPNFLFTAFPLNTFNDAVSTASFSNPSALAYGAHPAREDNVPGTSVEVLYLADAGSGRIFMVVWNAKRAYQIAHDFSSPTGVSWSECASSTGECLYVADAAGVWRVPLEVRCAVSGYSSTTCPVGSLQPAASIARSADGVELVLTDPVRRVFVNGSDLWTTQPDSIVRYDKNSGTVRQTVTGINPYGLVPVDGQGAFFTDIGDHRIKKVTRDDVTSGEVSVVAGSGLAAFGNGTGAQASFRSPHGITFHGNSPYLYVADTGNATIRRVNWETGATTTLLRSETIAETVVPPASSTGTVTAQISLGDRTAYGYTGNPTVNGITLPSNGHIYVNEATALGSGSAVTVAPHRLFGDYVLLSAYADNTGSQTEAQRTLQLTNPGGSAGPSMLLDSGVSGFSRNAVVVAKLGGGWSWVSPQLPLNTNLPIPVDLVEYDGDVFVAGRYKAVGNTGSSTSYVTLCRLDGGSGALLWCRNSSSRSGGSFSDLSVDGSGNLVLIGTTGTDSPGSSGSWDRWPNNAAATSYSTWNRGWILTVDPDTGYALGSVRAAGNFDPIFFGVDGSDYLGWLDCTSLCNLGDGLTVPAGTSTLVRYNATLGSYTSAGTALSSQRTVLSTGQTSSDWPGRHYLLGGDDEVRILLTNFSTTLSYTVSGPAGVVTVGPGEVVVLDETFAVTRRLTGISALENIQDGRILTVRTRSDSPATIDGSTYLPTSGGTLRVVVL